MNQKDSYWFRHDSNAKDDPKCVALIEQLGLEGYGIYWVLVEVLREQPDYTYPLALLPALARRYNTSAEKVKAVVVGYGLFKVRENKIFFSESLLERMRAYDSLKEKRRAAALIANESRWKREEKSDCDTNRIPNGKQTHPFATLYINSNNNSTLLSSSTSIDKSISVEESNIAELPFPSAEKPQNTEETAPELSNKNCQQVVDFWNSTIASLGANYARVEMLSDARKKKIRIRWKEFARVGDPVEVCRTLFRKACASKFMQGDNRNGWSAGFDWLFINDKNWLKVYEGNYDDKTASQQQQPKSHIDRMEEDIKYIHNFFSGNGTEQQQQYNEGSFDEQ